MWPSESSIPKLLTQLGDSEVSTFFFCSRDVLFLYRISLKPWFYRTGVHSAYFQGSAASLMAYLYPNPGILLTKPPRYEFPVGTAAKIKRGNISVNLWSVHSFSLCLSESGLAGSSSPPVVHFSGLPRVAPVVPQPTGAVRGICMSQCRRRKSGWLRKGNLISWGFLNCRRTLSVLCNHPQVLM